jgi:hypothetical protein
VIWGNALRKVSGRRFLNEIPVLFIVCHLGGRGNWFLCLWARRENPQGAKGHYKPSKDHGNFSGRLKKRKRHPSKIRLGRSFGLHKP